MGGEEKVIAKNRMIVKEKISNVIENSFKGWLSKIADQGNAAAKELAGTAASAIIEALGISLQKDDTQTGNDTSTGKDSAGITLTGKDSAGRTSTGKDSAGNGTSTGKDSAGNGTSTKKDSSTGNDTSTKKDSSTG